MRHISEAWFKKHAAEFHMGQCRIKPPPPNPTQTLPSPKSVITHFSYIKYLLLCLITISTTHTTAFITTYEVNFSDHRYIPPIRVEKTEKKGLRISVLKGHASRSCNTGSRLCSTGVFIVHKVVFDGERMYNARSESLM